MAMPVTRRPTVESRPRPSVTYIGFDNSQQLRQYRLERARQVEAMRQRQQTRTYKQLVRALSSALDQTKTTTKSSSAKSQKTIRSKPS